jgi:hypothetical protein
MSKDTPEYYRRKADQHWEMAGLARQDGDHKDEQKHTKLAREFDALAKEACS